MRASHVLLATFLAALAVANGRPAELESPSPSDLPTADKGADVSGPADETGQTAIQNGGVDPKSAGDEGEEEKTPSAEGDANVPETNGTTGATPKPTTTTTEQADEDSNSTTVEQSSTAEPVPTTTEAKISSTAAPETSTTTSTTTTESSTTDDGRDPVAVPTGRAFDGWSFFGGIILTASFMVLSVVGFKYYKARSGGGSGSGGPSRYSGF